MVDVDFGELPWIEEPTREELDGDSLLTKRQSRYIEDVLAPAIYARMKGQTKPRTIGGLLDSRERQ